MRLIFSRWQQWRECSSGPGHATPTTPHVTSSSSSSRAMTSSASHRRDLLQKWLCCQNAKSRTFPKTPKWRHSSKFVGHTGWTRCWDSPWLELWPMLLANTFTCMCNRFSSAVEHKHRNKEGLGSNPTEYCNFCFSFSFSFHYCQTR